MHRPTRSAESRRDEARRGAELERPGRGRRRGLEAASEDRRNPHDRARRAFAWTRNGALAAARPDPRGPVVAGNAGARALATDEPDLAARSAEHPDGRAPELVGQRGDGAGDGHVAEVVREHEHTVSARDEAAYA